MEENQSLLDLQVDREAAQQLTEVSRWGKFLGILISAGCGLVFLLIFFLWSRFASLLFPKDEVDPQNVQLARILIIVVFFDNGFDSWNFDEFPDQRGKSHSPGYS